MSASFDGKVVVVTGGASGIGRAAALAYAQDGIRVNAVCPGFTRTGIVERVLARGGVLGGEEQMIAYAPMGRMATPEEIAQAVLWLCSDAASFVTGETLSVDGGHGAL